LAGVVVELGVGGAAVRWVVEVVEPGVVAAEVGVVVVELWVDLVRRWVQAGGWAR
jgi:hypothetical protein